MSKTKGHKPAKRSLTAVLAGVCMALTPTAFAQQSVEHPGEAMSWLIGTWEGEGWSVDQTGTRETFDVFETVQTSANGRVVTVAGEGFAPAGSGRIGRQTHSASGFISVQDGVYEIRAVTGEGQSHDAPITLTDDGFEWAVDLGPHGQVVYSSTVSDGVWEETGAYCDATGACFPILYMRLERVGG